MKIKKMIAIICSAVLLCTSTAFAMPETYNEDIVLSDIEPFETQVFDGGTGTETDPFLISTEAQLVLINDFPTCSFKLLNDIELVDKWKYIGTYGDNFSGVLDGNGYCISGLTDYFTKYNKGTIKNVGFNTTACIVAYNEATMENCYSEGAVSQSGGFLHKNSKGGTITNCYSKGSKNCSAGFVYYNDGTITNCYCVGEGVGSGFVYSWYDYKGTLTNCYYDKQVSGVSDTYAGSQPKNTLAMKMSATYNDWDFENVWAVEEDINDGYPHLRMEKRVMPAINGLQLNITETSMIIGETLELTATVDPEDSDVTVNWQSSNTSVATVDSNGTVTANAVGAAVITASVGSVKAYCAVTVSDNSVKVESVTLDKNDTGIIIGETVKLTANVLPDNATNKNVKWSSSNSNVASVSADGTVTGLAEGTAKIYATSVSNSSCYDICNVTVAKQKIGVTGVEISGNVFGEFELNIGKTLTLTSIIKPSDATNKDVRWTSSDSKIANVINGKVTGVSEGSATITVTTVDGGYTASTIVNVTKPTVYVTGIALNVEQMTVNIKETKKLIAAVTPTDATDKGLIFKSNNNAIASVSSDGTVTGISAGTTLIQVTDSTGMFRAFCTVTVPKPVVEVTSVKLDKSSLEIVEGKTVSLKAIIKPTNATYKTITWSSSDESVVTVSQDGAVTARGVGEAVVSATAVNGVYVICNVTVLSSDTPAQLKVEGATVKAGKQIPITVSIASNPGISTFNFDLTYDNTKMYPVSYTKGDALSNVNIVTPLGSQSFKDKSSVRFLCQTADSKNMDSDGDLITVIFQTLSDVEYGENTIAIIPSAFTNQNYETVNLQSDNCILKITDYTIGDINNDDVVDLKDSMMLGQYLAGFDVELTTQGKKAAVSIYPDTNDNIETSEPTINDFQHLFRYLSDWQVELGKN